MLDEVIAAGGLIRWKPHEPLGSDDYQRALLKWLKGYDGTPNNAEKRAQLYIGHGDRDGLPCFEEIMGTMSPREQTLAAPGRHDWSTWRKMLGDTLERAPLPRPSAQ